MRVDEKTKQKKEEKLKTIHVIWGMKIKNDH